MRLITLPSVLLLLTIGVGMVGALVVQHRTSNRQQVARPSAQGQRQAWNTETNESVPAFFIAEEVPAVYVRGKTLRFGYSLGGAAATYPVSINSADSKVTFGPLADEADLCIAATKTHDEICIPYGQLKALVHAK